MATHNTTPDTGFDRRSMFADRARRVAYSARYHYLLRHGLPADVAHRRARVSANAAAARVATKLAAYTALTAPASGIAA